MCHSTFLRDFKPEGCLRADAGKGYSVARVISSLKTKFVNYFFFSDWGSIKPWNWLSFKVVFLSSQLFKNNKKLLLRWLTQQLWMICLHNGILVEDPGISGHFELNQGPVVNSLPSCQSFM